MRPIYIKIVIGSIILSSMLFANTQDNSKTKPKPKEPYETVWQKIYGGSDDDIAYGVVMLEDGDSAIVGKCKSAGAIRGDICVTRIDKDGIQNGVNLLLVKKMIKV